MARFYFHVFSTDDYIPDDHGSDLPSLSACHNHALRIIRECLPFIRDDPQRWWIEITDDKGENKLTVLYPCRVASGSRWRAPDPTNLVQQGLA